VNTVTSYEALIAKKLDQLPVPDMADSIWANIATQLDAPASGDGDHEPPQPQPGKGLPGIGKGFLFFAITAVIITAVWFYTGKKNEVKQNIQQPQNLPVAVSADTAVLSQPTAAPQKKQLFPVQTTIIKKDAPVVIDTATSLIRQNNPVAGIDLPPGKLGTPIISNKPMLDSATLAYPPKKPKGVKGISDNDYKIIGVKKDSAKKGE
jgi:hypothetical protein